MDQRIVNAALGMVVVALIVGCAYGGIVTFQSLSGTLPNRTISVSGTGSIMVSPDQAQVNVGAITQGNDAQQSAGANAQIMNQVIAQLHSLGLGNDSISTAYYDVSPLYSVKPNGSQTILGYQVQHQLLVKYQSSDLNKLARMMGQVVDSAIGAGANQVSGVQFTLSDSMLAQTKNQAIQSAIRDASSQAQALASALGLRITGVQSVSQGGPIYPPAYAAPQFSTGRSTPIPPGNLTITATVQVTYTIQ